MCWFRLVNAGVQLGGAAYFVVSAGPPGLTQILVLLACANVAAVVTSAPFVRPPVPYRLGGVRPEVAQLFHHGTHAATSRLGSAIHKSADLWMVAALGSPGAVALYGTAWKLADMVEMLLQPLIKVLVPEVSAVARHRSDLAASQAGRAVVVLTALTVAFTVALLVAPATWLELLGGPTYREAAPILSVLAVFNLTRPMDRVMGVLLDAMGHPKLNAQKVGLTLLMNLALTWIALTFGGPRALPGAALASLFSAGFGLALGDYFVERKTGRPMRHWTRLGWANRASLWLAP